MATTLLLKDKPYGAIFLNITQHSPRSPSYLWEMLMLSWKVITEMMISSNQEIWLDLDNQLIFLCGGMPLGLITGIGRAMRRKRTSSLDILSSKRAPRNYYKGKNCKPTGFHTRKGGYVVVPEKLPNYVVPDLTDFKLKPYVSQCQTG
ncbi:hypothetical protein SADUNF_Sadunf05G0115500 [Salix dunnii]|uniref:Ribosomal protein L41 n=1 Tax=Salix dunnii TaxID=1413687 RepID=A0A835KAR5_9ROSI|nr:hypothetical protein SADUNF_Sadunf05G0115500 [Salix dunnii]